MNGMFFIMNDLFLLSALGQKYKYFTPIASDSSLVLSDIKTSNKNLKSYGVMENSWPS